MRILTWNVNGLQTTLQYHPWSEAKSYKVLILSGNQPVGYNRVKRNKHPSFSSFQEVKCQRSKLTREMAIVPGYHAYFSFSKAKLGYSGVVTYVKDTLPQPIDIQETIAGTQDECVTPAKSLDAEGRSLVLDFGHFVLFNIYFPNDAGDARTQFKMDYHHCVQKRIEQALEHQHVILVGDINAAHDEIDHCDPKQSIKDHDLEHFQDLPQRRWLDCLVAPKGPLVDITRRYHPDRQKMFTCWNTRTNARPINFGTRIDYILPSTGLEETFLLADIQPDIMGSDHCPVYADFSDCLIDKMVQKTVYATSPFYSLNFPQFKHQQKLSDYFAVKRPLVIEEQEEVSQKPAKKTNTSSRLMDNYLIKTTQQPAKPVECLQYAINNQQTKSTWTSLFQAPQIPRCRHNEVCLERTVTKKGPNFGRVFYVCSKPVGPQNEPRDDQWSCNFFLWKQNKK
ncbi:DNA-(apurinic or apyrimidinic site) lyase 2 [Choanephora cucurbitarum]|uniref:DNA-(apurinic or apyrimidinic site) endonuclease n=1 Tax=Choanephora cucurbitarum TaxID=101091 RepID=A0A1C7NHS2_9FUNG|nr:DNA-(apurinic or apyrimidinic site) lyase 2 [Choanephora cucurbitarum]